MRETLFTYLLILLICYITYFFDRSFVYLKLANTSQINFLRETSQISSDGERSAGRWAWDAGSIIQLDPGDTTENTTKGTQPKESSILKHAFLLSKGQDVNECKQHIRKYERDCVS